MTERQQELDDIRVLLNTPAGERFIKRLLDLTGAFETSRSVGEQRAYENGRRDLGVDLFNDVVEVAVARVPSLLTVPRHSD